MEEEKKVIIKLKKEPLKSEREEIRTKRKKKFLIVLLCVCLFISGCAVGYLATYYRVGKVYTSHSNNKFDEIKEYLENVWLYKDEYADLDEYLEDKAFYGMTDFEDDPYTTYMSKEENTSFESSINMNYVGIGVQYYSYNDNAVVTRVFKESPAESAGMLKGDIIEEVDGKSLKGLSSDEIKDLVLGEEGSAIKIKINRNSEEIELMVVRGAVDSTVYARALDDIVILDILSFGVDTANECIKYLDDYKDYSKLIIDLRNDSGGLQTSVAGVAGLFLGKDVVYMTQTFSNGQQSEDKTTSNAYYENFKDIVILVNENTASAAEVLTMALKEQHENVTVVGNTTYGKGVVQSRYMLHDGSTIKITTSSWASPSGVSIDKDGIEPDELVLLDEIFYMTVPNMPEDTTYEIDDVSSYISIIQRGLNYIGYSCDRNDGYFDESLANELIKYRSNNGLETSDVLDKEIYDEILSEVSYIYSTDETRDPQLSKALEVLH